MAIPPAGPQLPYQGAPGQPPSDRQSIQTNAILLIVIGFLCGGTFPAIFGIIALVQIDTDPRSARQMNKIGWIVFWVVLALIVLFFIVYFVIGGLIMGVVMIPVLIGL